MAKTLYIGNLPYSITETQLSDHFKAYGSSRARIVEGRGFGFVDIEADQLDAAVSAMNNTSFNGRTITVNEAKPREPRNDGGNSYAGGSRSGSGGGGSRRW